MKNAIEAMLKKPIAAAGLVGLVTYCTIRVIKVIKGIDVEPIVKITVDKVAENTAE